MKIIIYLLCLFLSLGAAAQKSSRKELKRIYTALLEHTRQVEGVTLPVADSTSNVEFARDNFDEIAAPLRPQKPGLFLLRTVQLDSTWLPQLEAAGPLAKTLRDEALDKRITGVTMQLIRETAVANSTTDAMKRHIIAFSTEYLRLSNVMLFGNRAIVSVEKITSRLDGRRVVYFLEKKKRKWKIKAQWVRSIS